MPDIHPPVLCVRGHGGLHGELVHHDACPPVVSGLKPMSHSQLSVEQTFSLVIVAAQGRPGLSVLEKGAAQMLWYVRIGTTQARE